MSWHNGNPSYNNLGVSRCSGTKVSSCSDKTFPFDPYNPASKLAAARAANEAAQSRKYYESPWYYSGGSYCDGYEPGKKDCATIIDDITGDDCWPVEYRLRSLGVHCE